VGDVFLEPAVSEVAPFRFLEVSFSHGPLAQ
jgi:hypothetical protein